MKKNSAIGNMPFSSCKKDPDRYLLGEYIGTVYYSYDAIDPLYSRDSVYNNVSITLSESKESTRKEVRLNLKFNNHGNSLPSEDNLPVSNGEVDFSYGHMISPGTFLRWKGNIQSNIMDLIFRVENGNGSLIKYVIKANKK